MVYTHAKNVCYLLITNRSPVKCCECILRTRMRLNVLAHVSLKVQMVPGGLRKAWYSRGLGGHQTQSSWVRGAVYLGEGAFHP